MSYPNTYTLGTMVKLQASFKDAAGVTPSDPTTVTGSVTQPDGTVATLTPVKDTVGEYHADFIPAQEGMHIYRFVGTGAVIAAGEQSFLTQSAV